MYCCSQGVTDRDSQQESAGGRGALSPSRAEQSTAPDCLQRPLVRRSRFRQQVSASVGRAAVV